MHEGAVTLATALWNQVVTPPRHEAAPSIDEKLNFLSNQGKPDPAPKTRHFYLAETGHLYLAAIVVLRIIYLM